MIDFKIGIVNCGLGHTMSFGHTMTYNIILMK